MNNVRNVRAGRISAKRPATFNACVKYNVAVVRVVSTRARGEPRATGKRREPNQ